MSLIEFMVLVILKLFVSVEKGFDFRCFFLRNLIDCTSGIKKYMSEVNSSETF